MANQIPDANTRISPYSPTAFDADAILNMLGRKPIPAIPAGNTPSILGSSDNFLSLDPSGSGRAFSATQVPVTSTSPYALYGPGINALPTSTRTLPNIPFDVGMPNAPLPAGKTLNDLEAESKLLENGEGIKWFGKDGALIPGLNALSNLAGAYTGYKQLGLAEDAFNFNKALTLSNLANQATITNQAIEDRIRSGAINRGVPVPDVDKLVASQMENRRIKGTL